MSRQISNNYYSSLSKAYDKNQEAYSKQIGRYYTHKLIYENLISEVLSSMPETKDTFNIIDPFCGDGRLVYNIVAKIIANQEYKNIRTIAVTLIDIDEKALNFAAETLSELTKTNGVEVMVESIVGDAFILAPDLYEKYDICITNPPWCILKPGKQGFPKLSAIQVEMLEQKTEKYCAFLSEQYPHSKTRKRFGRWSANLSRYGAECALNLVKPNGVCGIVLPASFFSDQITRPLRRWIIEDHRLAYLSFFPAELKLFGDVDQSSSTAVIKKLGGPTLKFVESIYDKNANKRELILDGEAISFIMENDYVIPFEYSEQDFSIIRKLQKLGRLEKYPGIKIGREIDETRIGEKLLSTGRIRFVKGYMVRRYSVADSPIQYIDEQKINVPVSVNYLKIAWRDVSRASQKRRLQATILNSGIVTGNSLGVIYKPNASYDEMCFLLGVVNSYVFEFMARSRLVTNHVPSGVLRKIPIPLYTLNLCKKIAKVVTQCLANPSDQKTELILECMVGRAYGLTADEFMQILRMFQLSNSEYNTIMEVITSLWKKKELN